MRTEIKVPMMGESVSEAIIGTVFKQSGDIVSADEELLELETDKVNQILYAPSSGKLTWSANSGDKVSVGKVLGFIEESSEKKQENKPKEVPKRAKEEVSLRASKERFLEELKEPVKEAKREAELPSNRKRLSPLRKTIAARLVQVKNETAMLTTFNEVDMTAVMELRNKEKDHFLKSFGVKLGFMSFFVKAAVHALKAFPEINAFLEGDEIVYNDGCHIGIAVSTEKGLIVPVLKHAEKLTYAEIESQIEAYAKKAREGKIAMSDIQGGTFTITNGGVFGSLLSTPILNPPQSGILGMHTIQKRAVVVQDQIVIRPMMYLALSYDHRIVDGKEAVSFLISLKQQLEDPTRVLV